jgi:hypothetical protein
VVFEKLIAAHLIKKIKCIVWKQKVYSFLQNCLVVYYMLIQMNPLHAFTPHFFKIRLNIKRSNRVQ